MNLKKLTEDSILNGKLKIYQPKIGYRIPIDPIILASLVDVSNNKMILDAGCGVGTISLILKLKNPSAKIVSIDIDQGMCGLCRLNSSKNSADLEVYNANVKDIIYPYFDKYSFDCIVTNPPYFKEQSSRISASAKLAKFETLPLEDWIEFCLKKLNNKGQFAIIHDASRVDEILFALKKSRAKIGDTEITPIYSKKDGNAKRIIVKCKKNSKAMTKIMPSIIVHNEDGTYSSEMERILSGNFLDSSQ